MIADGLLYSPVSIRYNDHLPRARGDFVRFLLRTDISLLAQGVWECDFCFYTLTK